MDNDAQVSPSIPMSPKWILASSLTRYLLSQTLPLSKALQNKDHLTQIAREIRRAVNASEVTLADATKGHTLTAAGTLLYWMGFYAGFTVAPALGLAVVLLGSAGISAGFKLTCEAWRNVEFLRLFYSCLLLMQNADHIVTDQERRIVDEFLLSLELSESEKAEFRNMKAPILEELQVPDWVDDHQKKSILSGCWSLVYCDGISSVETKLFDRLGIKLQIPFEEIETLKKQAMNDVDRQEEKLLKLGVLFQTLMDSEDIPKPVLEVITQTSFKLPSHDSLMEAIQKARNATSSELPSDANETQFLLAGATLFDVLLTRESDVFGAKMQKKLEILSRKAGNELEINDFRALCGELFTLLAK